MSAVRADGGTVPVVLLGHRGFVGSAVAAHLRAAGVPFVGVDRANRETLRGTRAEVVINASGSSERTLAERDPLASFRANVDATMASLVDFPCERYVHLSTIAVYEHPTDPLRNAENAPIEPTALAPYAFQKYLGELVVRRLAPRWVVLRLGPMVGPGLRKNSIYDLLARGTLFYHPDSELPYIDTRAVAEIAWRLRGEAGEIFNVCGRGRVRLRDVARDLDVALGPELEDLPPDSFDVSIAKLAGQVTVAESTATVAAFTKEWRAGVR